MIGKKTLNKPGNSAVASGGGSRRGARGPPPPPLSWVKIEEMTEGRKAVWANKLKPGPHLSSKSRSATD